MTAHILSGKCLAENIYATLKQKINDYTTKGKRAPHLAVILVGDDPASEIYVSRKREACENLGIISRAYSLPFDIQELALLNLIQELNLDAKIDGILVQLPLPASIQKEKIIESISPDKDVDGFHPYNLGKLAQGFPCVRPCTPYGIMRLLEHYQISLTGKHAVIIGASTIVGRPMALELLNAESTVTICHSKTKNLVEHVKSADIVISATGVPHLIKADFIKENAVVIDVGTYRDDSGKLIGDVDFESVKEKASYITPVPGGVGLMTVAMLMKNTVDLWEKNS